VSLRTVGRRSYTWEHDSMIKLNDVHEHESSGKGVIYDRRSSLVHTTTPQCIRESQLAVVI
jgi:hypothetical protein